MKEMWQLFKSMHRAEKIIIIIVAIVVLGGITNIKGIIYPASAVRAKQLSSNDQLASQRETSPIAIEPTTTAEILKPSTPQERPIDEDSIIKQAQQWCAANVKVSSIIENPHVDTPDQAVKDLTFKVGRSAYQISQEASGATTQSRNTTERIEERRYLFTMDLIRCLKLCSESRKGKISADDRLTSLKAIYDGREKLLKAKNIMEGWKDSEDKPIAELTKDFSRGLDDWILAADLFGKVFDDIAEYPESDAALGSAKLESARQAIFDSSFSVIYVISSEKPYTDGKAPSQFYLSKQHLDSINGFIEANFNKELEEYSLKEKSRANGSIKDYAMPDEVWSAIFLRNFILQRSNH